MKKKYRYRYRKERGYYYPSKNKAISLDQKDLDVITDHKLLTKEQEVELGTKALAGDKEAQDILVKHNIKLIIPIAASFYTNRMTMGDCISLGTFGLIEAAKRFDPKKNVKFSTYATIWIRRFLLNAYHEQRSPCIHIPRHMFYIPTLITAGEKFSEKQMNYYEKAMQLLEPTSDVYALEEMNNENAPKASEKEEPIYDTNDYANLFKSLNQLDSREQLIIEGLYGLGKYTTPLTIHDLEEILNITKSRIHQIKNDAMEKLQFLFFDNRAKGKRKIIARNIA